MGNETQHQQPVTEDDVAKEHTGGGGRNVRWRNPWRFTQALLSTYTTCYLRRERSGIAWLIAGTWQLEGVRRNADKGRCPLCLEREDVKHILLECKETTHWRVKLIHDKWLNMNKVVACRKIMKITNRTHIQNVGKYLDIVKNKWFNKIKDM